MKSRQLAPLLIVLAIAGGGWWWFSTPQDASDTLTATGTIEAVEVVVAAEVSGRVTTIGAGDGELVDKNQTLLKLDDALLNAQRTQAAAAAAAAQSSATKPSATCTPAGDNANTVLLCPMYLTIERVNATMRALCAETR